MQIEFENIWRINNLQGTELNMNERIEAIHACTRFISQKFGFEANKLTIDLRHCGEEFDVWAAVNCEDFDKLDFYMMIDPTVDINEFFLAYCHEMVHIWQACRGDLIDVEEGVTAWKNKVIDPNTSYMNLPWEIEAHEIEGELFQEWTEHWENRKS